MTALTGALAGFGGIFWVIAGRLQSATAIGVAGTLVSAIIVLCFVAQIGIDRTLLASLPHSDRPAADFARAVAVVGVLGYLLGVGFATALPYLAPETAEALSGWRPWCFGLLVAGTAVNLTTDVAFLSLRRVQDNLLVTGIGMGILKCALPFALGSWGAFGLAASVGFASLAAAVACVLIVLVRLPRPSRPPGGGWSPAFRTERRLGFSSYLSSLIDFVPILLLPIILVNAAGAAENAVFFIAFQIVLMLNASAYAIGNSAFAEAARVPDRAGHALRHSAKVMAVIILGGTAVTVLAARLMLLIFGAEYAETGVPTLRILAVGAIAVATAYWAITALRVRHRLMASVAVAAVSAGGTTLLAWLLADRGAEAAALAWLIGHGCGALLGLVLVRWGGRR
ncbi:hypothetical protein G5C66_04610 [Nocardioides sp. KC13]|uniref:Oligosaccharide flippase family protein n=1 Tax=Nocardioides turkmenicus TaxID=2711220 RepID=A0A6M1R2P4_9ACTN|nr:hypothetical protein [Nocardioides sp. KC13]NGN92019.1 hypothetical protein [Nocardioides sp. KC13]